MDERIHQVRIRDRRSRFVHEPQMLDRLLSRIVHLTESSRFKLEVVFLDEQGDEGVVVEVELNLVAECLAGGRGKEIGPHEFVDDVEARLHGVLLVHFGSEVSSCQISAPIDS